jgi:hypothetical protein
MSHHIKVYFEISDYIERMVNVLKNLTFHLAHHESMDIQDNPQLAMSVCCVSAGIIVEEET